MTNLNKLLGNSVYTDIPFYKRLLSFIPTIMSSEHGHLKRCITF